MTEFKIRTIGNSSPSGKPKVYFTCHPSDFSDSFGKICEDILSTGDVALYYTEDMSEPIDDENLLTDLACMSLVVVPVTLKLLSEENRAMDFDIAFAKEQKIRILPIMMEGGIDSLYSQPDKFDKLQYLKAFDNDETEIKYEDKLRNHLDSIVINDETVRRIRAEFDAYIFLSYRKKNRSLANKLMKLIHSNPELQGIAIWYDEFLRPGEDFNNGIDEMLEKCKIFTLMVTPEILEKPNFVMDYEYPMARKLRVPIVPAEMKETDKDALRSAYEGIPECVSPDSIELKSHLMQELLNISIKGKDSPEHNYLIGLAYLEGIDVEINKELGMSLITEAAEADYPEAVAKLYNSYSLDGNYEMALVWNKRLCEIYERILPENHPDTLESLNDLAYSYRFCGNEEKAREIFEMLYVTRAELLGEHHPDTLRSLYSLADTYCRLSDYRNGLRLLNKLYNVRLEALGEEHPDTIACLSSLSKVYGEIGEHSKSVELAERAYELERKSLGEEHNLTMGSLYELASKYEALSENERALELYERLYLIADKIGNDYYKYSTFVYLISLCKKDPDAPRVRALMERIPDIQFFLF